MDTLEVGRFFLVWFVVVPISLMIFGLSIIASYAFIKDLGFIDFLKKLFKSKKKRH